MLIYKTAMELIYCMKNLISHLALILNKVKAYAIYAPNGIMKSSFTKTFEAISKGELPKEERYNRPSVCQIAYSGEKGHPFRFYPDSKIGKKNPQNHNA